MINDIEMKEIKKEIEIKLSPLKNIHPDWCEDMEDFILKKILNAKGKNIWKAIHYFYLVNIEK